jgi:hypothetical protein
MRDAPKYHILEKTCQYPEKIGVSQKTIEFERPEKVTLNIFLSSSNNRT